MGSSPHCADFLVKSAMNHHWNSLSLSISEGKQKRACLFDSRFRRMEGFLSPGGSEREPLICEYLVSPPEEKGTEWEKINFLLSFEVQSLTKKDEI